MSLNANNSTDSENFRSAIAALDAQEVSNYSEIAKKFNVNRTTLSRRHKGLSQSISQAHLIC
ncbi:hypothetical protein EV356DRAFT_350994 [Viridothelium virens]|uniref:HTH psq-type domain-containing protein n=1 Tax=Viridothelium virens TaxID=1048519 RepID=A0A6A6GWN1_VIRVR|nr:hypothetical protein EV356DRAFT_350994 [Viridothelium virens]